jgi:hypothetical protein
MKTGAESPRADSAALMADQAALVLAGMLFGGCGLDEDTCSDAQAAPDSAACGEGRKRQPIADSGSTGRAVHAA